jgi:hypothetical protein
LTSYSVSGRFSAMRSSSSVGIISKDGMESYRTIKCGMKIKAWRGPPGRRSCTIFHAMRLETSRMCNLRNRPYPVPLYSLRRCRTHYNGPQ